MEKIGLILSKIGTLFGDRRFQTSLLALLGLFLVVPEVQGMAYIQAISLVLLALANVASQTKRPPSGLKFREQLDFESVMKLVHTLAVNYPEQKE
jgi:hypothetical protein